MLAVQARDLASYNSWMNQHLYAACSQLPDPVRKKDSGAFSK